uniref:Tripartite motif containing 35-28 n=1 Tax=Stegastes partitus TaxID=144197 RepID=A0A3B4ZJY3_9TELE
MFLDLWEEAGEPGENPCCTGRTCNSANQLRDWDYPLASGEESSKRPLEMASGIFKAKIDFSCPICQDIFSDPVVLSCSHSFCKVCLQRWWSEKKIHECPVCKRRSSRKISVLSETVRATNEDLRATDVFFLQNYTTAVERIEQRSLMDDPQLVSGALVDVAKHLGNLTYDVWNKMMHEVSYCPVILDPNTAEPNLRLHQDLTAVMYQHTKGWAPRNPERFEGYLTVLGSEGFDSGTHSWVVEVGNNADWAVGVIGESVQRKADMPTGCWSVWFRDGKYRAFSPTVKDKALSVKKPLQRIRVHLDCKSKTVTFSDPDRNTTMHTFPVTLTEKLFPFINTQNCVFGAHTHSIESERIWTGREEN